MITVSQVKFGLLLDAINEVEKDTCTTIWCDMFPIDDNGDLASPFCEFHMSFRSGGDIEPSEERVREYTRQIESAARMVRNLNAYEFSVELENTPVHVDREELKKLRNVLKTIAEMEFDNTGGVVEQFLITSLKPTKRQ